MAFGGTMGAAGNLIPFGIIFNLKGEQAAGYDAAGRIRFTNADGVVYTPERVDTLVVNVSVDEINGPPLKAIVPGGDSIANADCGELVTSAPAANEHGLPTNFGPGRGNWNEFLADSGPYSLPRVRVGYQPKITAPQQGFGGQGSVMTTDQAPVGAADLSVRTRNFFGVDIDKVLMVVECLHSIQG